MVTETAFDAEKWIARLGASLEALAPTAEYSLSPQTGYVSYRTYDEFRALEDAAGRDPDSDATPAPNGALFRSDPAEQRAILRDHPVLRQALAGAGKDEAMMFLTPNRSFRISSRGLVSDLVRQTVTSTGVHAARLLHRYLSAGKAKHLQAREFVVIYGLKVATRIDLGAGAFLAPLNDRLIAEEGFSEDDADQLRTFGVSGRNFRDGSGGSTVLVRDLNWGPGVTPASGDDDFDHSEVAFRFPCDVETVIDLLSATAHCPLVTSTRHIRAAKWMHDINANFTFGWWGGGGFVYDGWWKERELSEEAEANFRKSIAGWAVFRFASDQERDALNLALRRISGSFARVGRMQLQDRILDYAIALEIMYRLDRSELTYKLSTRAACLLGKTPEMRIATFEKIGKFYDIRSAIVHGPSPRKQRKLAHDDFERACAEGQTLAFDTLSELLGLGRFPDWKRLVFEHPTEPVSLPGPVAADQDDG